MRKGLGRDSPCRRGRVTCAPALLTPTSPRRSLPEALLPRRPVPPAPRWALSCWPTPGPRAGADSPRRTPLGGGTGRDSTFMGLPQYTEHVSLLHLPQFGAAEPHRTVRIVPLSPVPGDEPDPEASIETAPTPIVRMAPVVRGDTAPAKRTVAFGRFSAVNPGAVEPPIMPVPGATTLAGLAREGMHRPAVTADTAQGRPQLRTGGTIVLDRARDLAGQERPATPAAPAAPRPARTGSVQLPRIRPRALGAGGALGRIAELLLPRPAVQRTGGVRRIGR